MSLPFTLLLQGSFVPPCAVNIGTPATANYDTYEGGLGANLDALVFQPALDDVSAGQAIFALNDWDVEKKAIKVR